MKQLLGVLVWWGLLWCLPVQAQILAFPGAEGYGRFAAGGRGGKIVYVTTLANDGPGSLRYALRTPEPRIVVFRVAGTIQLQKAIKLEAAHSRLTLAGETAPGEGITIAGAGLIFEKVHDVIIRYLRIRPGLRAYTGGTAYDALTIKGSCRRIIVDHVSLSWSLDEVLDLSSWSQDITVQWSLLAEDLFGYGDKHWSSTFAMIAADAGTRATVHHSLLTHTFLRLPKISQGTLEFVNNTIYNCCNNQKNGYALFGLGTGKPQTPLRVDVLDNTWLSKPALHPSWMLARRASNPMPADPQIYIEGNQGSHAGVEPTLRSFLVSTRVADSGGLTREDAAQAHTKVMAFAGASLVRDSVDRRLIQEIANRQGALLATPAQVGGWPVLATALPYPDQDQDGMDDTWEVAQGLNPQDGRDGPQDADGDGWTNVEEFLHSLVPAATASARTLEDLTQRLDALERRVDELEKGGNK